MKISKYFIKPKRNLFYTQKQLPGVGQTTILKACHSLDLNPYTSVKNLTVGERDSLIKHFEAQDAFGVAYFRRRNAIMRGIKKLKAYRGKRLIFGLPVRGQRTHSNAKTIRKMKHLSQLVEFFYCLIVEECKKEITDGGQMAEWLKASVLKTEIRKDRGFESLSA